LDDAARVPIRWGKEQPPEVSLATLALPSVGPSIPWRDACNEEPTPSTLIEDGLDLACIVEQDDGGRPTMRQERIAAGSRNRLNPSTPPSSNGWTDLEADGVPPEIGGVKPIGCEHVAEADLARGPLVHQRRPFRGRLRASAPAACLAP
jgi:hypothetical protein